MGKSISQFEPVGGNQAPLMNDANAAIDSMVADIDAASDHGPLLFYIWMPDNHVTYCGSQNCADPEFLTEALQSALCAVGATSKSYYADVLGGRVKI